MNFGAASSSSDNGAASSQGSALRSLLPPAALTLMLPPTQRKILPATRVTELPPTIKASEVPPMPQRQPRGKYAALQRAQAQAQPNPALAAAAAAEIASRPPPPPLPEGSAAALAAQRPQQPALTPRQRQLQQLRQQQQLQLMQQQKAQQQQQQQQQQKAAVGAAPRSVAKVTTTTPEPRKRPRTGEPTPAPPPKRRPEDKVFTVFDDDDDTMQSESTLNPLKACLDDVALHGYFKVCMSQIRHASSCFWLRRQARLRALKVIAEDCAKVGPIIRQKAAELRADAARRRLELLRSGDLAGYRSALGLMRETRLQEFLDETAGIARQLGSGDGDAVADKEVDENKLPSFAQPSLVLNGVMLKHQMQGLRWLSKLFETRGSGILADDMGLGKTVQTLSLLAYMMETRQVKGPHLICVPVSTLPNWIDEMRYWTPCFRFTMYRGNDDKRSLVEDQLVNNPGYFNVVLTNYESFTLHHSFLYQIPWHTFVIDEGHRLKNANTHFSKSARALPCRHRLLLTGTPLQNSLAELWSLLAFVAPREFGSLKEFQEWFALPSAPTMKLQTAAADVAGDGAANDDEVQDEAERQIAKAEEEQRAMLSEEQELLVIQRLHNVLRPFMLRRTKDQVLKDLPEKVEVAIFVPLSRWQWALYRGGVRKVAQRSAKFSSKKDKLNDYLSGANTFQLRKAINHPYHYLNGDENILQNEDNVIRSSGKFEFLDRFLPRFIQFGHKILIFAQMAKLINLLEHVLKRRGILFERLDGSKSVMARNRACERFRRDPACHVMLLTTRAGGIGINLQAADTVILFDSDWNPQIDLQAVDRAHRIGQTRPVRVVRLLTPTGLDEGLVNRTGFKLDMERKVIGAGRFHEAAGTGDDDVQGAVKQGPSLQQVLRDARRSASSKGVVRATPLAEVNRLLARSEEERAAFDAADVELLGAPAADEEGNDEGVADRLERCGRLLSAKEVPRLNLGPLAPSKGTASTAQCTSGRRRTTGYDVRKAR